ncbi:superoxide dismutase [Candidatus Collierbacteria bacterium RIFOXYB1_FULL_49_13]|uniref:Superoxide dismutase n=1 Tax=Candidatus Collierbacteria bacterium RIFOXYB1_FULL_49_13 TaxID=1817728 RepID=A0A1F5FH93_9BACT|nr:MAG: superoxide dismutase [Candidatus Collierbacteria bacterium RIFOXYB1_FULL_49_13]
MTQHTLPKLPYAFTALEPYIDAQTMELHYTKHHQTYVDKLNAALAGTPDQVGRSLEDLLTHLDTVPESIRAAVRNHGGGHYNHTHFWQALSPRSSSPEGVLQQLIEATFSSTDGFITKFKEAGLAHFGSGWVWLTIAKNKLEIITTPNQDTPLAQNLTPLLGIDLWEHAYYLKYQNRRADYLDAIFHVINWKQVLLNLSASD